MKKILSIALAVALMLSLSVTALADGLVTADSTATIDIYQPNKALMKQWGRRVVEIEVIEWGSSRLSMEKLSDRRGYKHCRQMYAALQEQSRHRNTAKR